MDDESKNAIVIVTAIVILAICFIFMIYAFFMTDSC